MTTVGRISASFVEAGWLVVAVLVATLLNPFSDQVFEPDKAALLRVLVVLMVAAWVILSLDCGLLAPRGGSEGAGAGRRVRRAIQSLFDQPIVGLALLLLLINLASTITSVLPRVSWWGSYQRAQGTYTFLAYLGLFFTVLAVLRRADQFQRLITVLLFTSFPVALYAILQHYGMSLLQFSESGVETRVISTLGNAIFLGAYLAMVVPLTLWRLLESVTLGARWRTRAATAGTLYGGLLVLQLAAIVFTQSRGPILGLLAELFVFVLLIALLRRQRRWALAGVIVSGTVVILLVALNIPGLSTESLRRLPYVARFGELAGAGAQTVQARALAWDTVLDAMRAEPGRLVLGYGPETMKPVLTRYMPAQLWVLQGGGQYGTFDRAHNAVFDALYAHGMVGAVFCLLLYGVIFHEALRWLGLVQSRSEAGGLIGLLIAGAVLGLLIPWLWLGDPVLAAVGIPIGMIAGMVLYLLGQVVLLRAHESAADETHLLLMAALLAAIVGHFVETQTGIAVVVTQTYFWLYTALLMLLGTGRITAAQPGRSFDSPSAGLRAKLRPQRPVSQPAGRGRFRRSRRGRRRGGFAGLGLYAEGVGSVAVMSLLVAVLLGTLSYAFIHGFNAPGARRPAQALVGVTWLFAGLMVLLERHRFAANAESLSSDALTYATTSLVWVLPFALYHRMNAQVLDRLNSSYLVFVVWVLLTAAGVAAALRWSGSSSRPTTQSSRFVLYPMILLLALALVWRVDVTRIQADIHEKVGKTAIGAGLLHQAIPNLQQAVALQPWQDQYYIFLAGAYVEQARLLSEPEMKDAQMERARQILEQGRALSPRDSDQPRQLGLAFRVWADWAQDEATRQQRLQESLGYYLASVDLNPQNPDLRLDLAGAYFALRMNEEAFAQFQHTVAIGAPSHLGRAYAGLGDIYLVRGEPDAAAEAYRKAMQAGRDRQEVVDSRVRAVDRYPENIQVRLSLALVYAAAERKGDALKELNAALDMASSDAERAGVEKLIAMVEE